MDLIEKYYSHLSGLTEECQYTMKHAEGAAGAYSYVAVASPADKMNIVNNGYIARILENYLKAKGMNTRLRNPDKDIMRIIGEMVVEEDVTDYDAVVNALNIVAPKVIISKMAYDRLEVMMTNYRKYLNAEVWIAMNDQMNLNEERRNLLRVLTDTNFK